MNPLSSHTTDRQSTRKTEGQHTIIAVSWCMKAKLLNQIVCTKTMQFEGKSKKNRLITLLRNTIRTKLSFNNDI